MVVLKCAGAPSITVPSLDARTGILKRRTEEAGVGRSNPFVYH
jgi:hypothetical protein